MHPSLEFPGLHCSFCDYITEDISTDGYNEEKTKGAINMLNLNLELFNKHIAGESPVLVDYWAPWCGYCRRIAPALEKIAEQYEGNLVVGKVNIDEVPELAQRERIEVIPTLVLYQNGEVLGSIVAPESKARIEEFIEENLGM